MQQSLIIVASGMATRLSRLHQNVYPKLLMNVGQNTVIDNILKSFEHLTSDIHIILGSEKHINQVKEYLLIRYGSYDNVTFHLTENSISSGYSLKKHMNILPKSSYIVWSDIWSANPVEHTDVDTIYVDTKRRHRYNFEDGTISRIDEGNICGMYFVEDIHQTLSKDMPLTSDFVNYVSNKSRMIQLDIVDTGDELKYLETLRNQKITSRFFNSIEMLGDMVIKKPVNSKGVEVIKHEAMWYDKLNELNLSNLSPKHEFDRTSNVLKLDKIHGKLLYEVPVFFANAVKTLKLLHFHNSEDSDTKSLINEYIEVPILRSKSIQNIIPEISSVNGLQITENLFDIFSDKLIKPYIETVERFAFIHGDPNSSNIIIDENFNANLIDPRGKFGHTDFYGDKNYDYAKLIYGITGYDNFNKQKVVEFEYDHTTKSIQIEEFVNLDVVKMYCKRFGFDKSVAMIVSIIWYKLPAYTINDINKAIVANATGSYLMQILLNEESATELQN